MEFREHVLPNGLEVVAECNPKAHSCAFTFWVKAGARDETPELSGVSHFLEHMVFKGTDKRTAEDVNREFDEMGADYNAGTGDEATDYHAFLLPENLDWALELWSDVLRPALREDDFTMEKKVIVEEIRESLDQPPYGADDHCKERFFGDHPLSRGILGTVESVEALTVDAMRSYFDERYVASNITLVAAGKIEFDRLVETAEKLCGHWPSGKATRRPAQANPRFGFEVQEKASSHQQYVVQRAPSPGAGEDGRYAAHLLCAAMASATGGRLYWDLIDSGEADSVSLSPCDYFDAGFFLTFMSCAPDQTAANLQVIQDHFQRVEKDGITQAELDQVRNKIKSRRVLASERPRGRLFNIANNWTYRR
ncbi:MAG: insulinase family protein, partial [Planctomycetales bacterium]